MTKVYLTKKGAVFTTPYRIVRRGPRLALLTQVVAEAGDLINVEGEEFHNLSRAELGYARVRYPLRGMTFALPIAC